MNTQIIYFQVKDFDVPFMTLQRIALKFCAKIMKRSCVFCCSSCISFNPTNHLLISFIFQYTSSLYKILLENVMICVDTSFDPVLYCSLDLFAHEKKHIVRSLAHTHNKTPYWLKFVREGDSVGDHLRLMLKIIYFWVAAQDKLCRDQDSNLGNCGHNEMY